MRRQPRTRVQRSKQAVARARASLCVIMQRRRAKNERPAILAGCGVWSKGIGDSGVVVLFCRGWRGFRTAGGLWVNAFVEEWKRVDELLLSLMLLLLMRKGNLRRESRVFGRRVHVKLRGTYFSVPNGWKQTTPMGTCLGGAAENSSIDSIFTHRYYSTFATWTMKMFWTVSNK